MEPTLDPPLSRLIKIVTLRGLLESGHRLIRGLQRGDMGKSVDFEREGSHC